MNDVNKIPSYPPYQELPAKPQRSRDEIKNIPNSAAASRKDCTDLSSEWGSKDNAQALLDELLQSFSRNYPDLDIFITDKLDKASLPDEAAALGEGTHLLLSREFLEEMKSSQKAYQKGKAILIRLLGQLSAGGSNSRAQGVYVGRDEALFWSAPKLDKNQQSPAQTVPNSIVPTAQGEGTSPPSFLKQLWTEQESTRKSYSDMRKNKTKVSLQAISHSYSSLSAARTKGQVQSVIAKTQRNIASLRLSASLGEAEERMKARAAIASMQKLLQRGGRKIRRLNEEELVRLRQKRAQRLNDQKKELQLRMEREMLRAKRRSADGAIKKEGELEELNQSMRFGRRSKYYPYESSLPAQPIPELLAASAAPSVNEAGASAPLAAADISVTSVSIEF